MSLPRYPAYKDSGVEWLGQVPAHWEARRLKHLITKIEQGWSPQCMAEPAVDEDWGVLKVGCVNQDDFDPSEQKALPSEIAPITEYEVGQGDILMSRGNTRELVGMAALIRTVRPRLMLSDLLYRFRAIDHCSDSEFIVLSLRSSISRFQIERESTGTSASMKKISQGTIRELLVCSPPLAEQQAIATFLDRETAKIDALIAEQQRLIDLLKEKRQAVISHTVTKGLDPDAPMKDSGVEWLGEIPAHWTFPPVYVRYHQALGKMLDHGKMTGEHPTPYLRNLDVRWDYINSDDLPLMDIAPHEKERFMVRKGDLLMVEGRELGRCAIWDGSDGEIAFQKALHRLRPMDSSEHTRFFFYMMAFANSTAVFLANQSPNEIPHLTGEELRRYRFPKPPIHEQVAIAAFLDAETARLDALTAEAQRAIDLLRERRAALISAAVTGQIDVRLLSEASH